MSVWRLLPIQTHDGFTNMAIDEAVMLAVACGKAENTLRFYCWNPSTVSIGRFQNMEDEVQIENCKKHGVDIVRRISGGGAVYHDSLGEVTYSVIAKEKDLGSTDIATLYIQICQGLIEAMKILGAKADFNPGNYKQCPNVTVNGKKISGSAQCHRSGVILQHGTLLIETNLERMFTFLKVKWARTPAEVVCIAKDRITSLKEILGTSITLDNVYNALVEGFKKALKIQLEKETLTSYEEAMANKLRQAKYASKKWNFEGRIEDVDFNL